MVIVELLEGIVHFAFEHLGVSGVSVGVVALLLAAIWYGRELSHVLLGAARWLRIWSVVIGVLAIGAVAAIATGAISLDSGVVAQLLELLGSLAGGH